MPISLALASMFLAVAVAAGTATWMVLQARTPERRLVFQPVDIHGAQLQVDYRGGRRARKAGCNASAKARRGVDPE